MRQEITLRQLQEAILKIDHRNNSIDKYFYKLSEEVGELAKVIRKNQRLATSESIKDTIEEELYDVLYYVVCLANMHEIDLNDCARLKEELNAKKYGRNSIFDE